MGSKITKLAQGLDTPILINEKGRPNGVATLDETGRVPEAQGGLIIQGHVDAGGDAHPLATTESAGFMSAEDKGKLDGGGSLDALIGVPLPWYDTEPPAWAFPADGRYLNPNSFPKLFEKYGYRFGYQYQTVDGVSVKFFRIPDLRGEFIRGLDLGRGVDLGRELGTWQEDEFKEHAHTYSRASGGMNAGMGGGSAWNALSAADTGLSGGLETRPRNVAFLYIIPFMSIPLGGAGSEVNLGTVDVLVNYKPKYVSSWFAVAKAQTYTVEHSLGDHPSNVRIQFSPVINPGPTDKIVNFGGLEYGTYNATVAFDATNVYIYFGGDRVYDGPDGNNSGANPPFGSLQSGYARILAWE